MFFSIEGRKKNRSQRSAKNVSNCSHHLIEQCPLPQWCNSFCPTFRNQYNGKEIDFFKVFAASGMDSKAMAELLGVNTSTVNAMNANTISTLLLDTFRQKRPQWCVGFSCWKKRVFFILLFMDSYLKTLCHVSDYSNLSLIISWNHIQKSIIYVFVSDITISLTKCEMEFKVALFDSSVLTI